MSFMMCFMMCFKFGKGRCQFIGNIENFNEYMKLANNLNSTNFEEQKQKYWDSVLGLGAEPKKDVQSSQTYVADYPILYLIVLGKPVSKTKIKFKSNFVDPDTAENVLQALIRCKAQRKPPTSLQQLDQTLAQRAKYLRLKEEIMKSDYYSACSNCGSEPEQNAVELH